MDLSSNWSFGPRKIFIVASRHSFQFSNNVCFDRIILNSYREPFWTSLWCKIIIFISSPLFSKAEVWGDFHNSYKWTEDGLDVLTASKHEKSQVLLTRGLLKVAYSQILWFMGVNKKLLGPAIGGRELALMFRDGRRNVLR